MPTTRYFSYRRRKRRRNFLLFILLILLLTAAGVLTWLAVSSLIGKHEESSPRDRWRIIFHNGKSAGELLGGEFGNRFRRGKFAGRIV